MDLDCQSRSAIACTANSNNSLRSRQTSESRVVIDLGGAKSLYDPVKTAKIGNFPSTFGNRSDPANTSGYLHKSLRICHLMWALDEYRWGKRTYCSAALPGDGPR
jgi:hypothetical protein